MLRPPRGSSAGLGVAAAATSPCEGGDVSSPPAPVSAPAVAEASARAPAMAPATRRRRCTAGSGTPAPYPAAYREAGMDWLNIALAFVLVGTNGFFVATEFAIARLRPGQVKRWVS